MRRVLYRLPELLASEGPVYVVEGEKDVEAMRRHGHVATCNPGGAGKWHIVEACAARALSGRDVVIISDRDDVGRKHANETAGHVRKVAKSCVVLEPPEPHKDVSDVLLSKLTLDALVAMQGPKPKGLPVPPKSEPPVWEDDEDPSGERQKDPRPSVQMLTSDVGKNVAALDQAIASHIPDVFQRALQLVEVIAEKKPGLIPIGAPSLRVLTAHSAETHISEKSVASSGGSHQKRIRWAGGLPAVPRTRPPSFRSLLTADGLRYDPSSA